MQATVRHCQKYGRRQNMAPRPPTRMKRTHCNAHCDTHCNSILKPSLSSGRMTCRWSKRCTHLLQHMRTFVATHAHICCNTCTHLLQHMHTCVATHAHICCNTCTHLLQHMHSFVAVSCSLLHTHRLDGGVQRFLHGKIVPTIRSP